MPLHQPVAGRRRPASDSSGSRWQALHAIAERTLENPASVTGLLSDIGVPLRTPALRPRDHHLGHAG